MYKKVLTACAGFAVLLLVSSMAFAGVPCAGTTTVVATGDDVCAPGAAVCPAGDLHTVNVVVTVRDCYGAPLSGQYVDVSPAGVAPAADEGARRTDGDVAQQMLVELRAIRELLEERG